MQNKPFPFPRSRLSPLSYCWKCNDPSHLYSNCHKMRSFVSFNVSTDAAPEIEEYEDAYNITYSVFYMSRLPKLSQCCICLMEDVSQFDTLYLNCKHGFCEDCLTNQIEKNILTCALCRENIKYFVKPK